MEWLKTQALESDRPGFCHLFTVHLGQGTKYSKTQRLSKLDICKRVPPRIDGKIK